MLRMPCLWLGAARGEMWVDVNVGWISKCGSYALSPMAPPSLGEALMCVWYATRTCLLEVWCHVSGHCCWNIRSLQRLWSGWPQRGDSHYYHDFPGHAKSIELPFVHESFGQKEVDQGARWLTFSKQFIFINDGGHLGGGHRRGVFLKVSQGFSNSFT